MNTLTNNLTIYEVLLATTKECENRTALVYEYKHFTYSYVLKRVNSLAASLTKLGYKRDDVITIMLPNIPMAVYLLYAINQIGAIANIVHPLTGPSQLKKIIEKCNSNLIFALDTKAGDIASTLGSSVKVYGCSPTDELPFFHKLYYRYKTRKEKHYKIKAFDLLNVEPLTEYDRTYLKDSFYLHSSGTSGESKIVALSSFAINSLSMQGLKIYNLDDAHGIGMLSVLPMFHGFGLCMGIHISFAIGAYNVLMPKFKTNKVINYISLGIVHTLIGVPTLYEALLRNPRFSGFRLHHLKYAFVGGDFTSTSLCRRFDERLAAAKSKARLYVGYGMTEVVAVASVNTPTNNKFASVGKALDNVEIKAFSPEQFELMPNHEGELYISGDTLMNGYRFEDTPSNSIFIDHNQKKWLKTGDYGKVDEEGYVYFIQRLKRIIKISGVNVFPNEIENAIMELPYIYDCYVRGVVDEQHGNILKLYLVLDKKFQGQNYNEDINKIIISKFGIYALPKEIVYLPAFPKTLMGKKDMRKLDEMDR